MSDELDISRRAFLTRTGAAAALAAPGPGAREVTILADPSDPVAAAAPARWAAKELGEALAGAGCPVQTRARIGDAAPGSFCILAGGGKAAGVAAPGAAESLALASSKLDGRAVLAARGADARGLAYALLELADRVRHADRPLAALEVRKPIVERPANRIRGINRSFVSDIEDKPWYNDRSFWEQYFSVLAAQRFNRFSLTLGLGYNFPRNARDVYFYFAYPFLVAPSGHRVRAAGLTDSERDRNLEMLRFISGAAAERGIDFQLGLWTHAYQWVDSPNANYTIEGLTAANHASYSRDALRMLLETCPAISGVTFRVHGESGVPEESFDFWKAVFDGMVKCGRKVEIDMHAKGMDQRMI
ncbi:MAG: twin-arginine translocation signal domain-containing protein, partial [Acidobacteria bacterium]|nr:twin-arginine translocation signal domain-containing protein [Acidobacteriota bacterium]